MNKIKLYPVLAAVALALAGCAAVPASATVTHKADPLPRVAPVMTFAAVGDSITRWTDGSGPNGTGNPVATSWTRTATSPQTPFVGGYAASGDKSFEILAGMKPISPFHADALVVMVGRNDVTLMQVYPASWSMAQAMQTVQQIVATSGVKKILISSIAPCGPDCTTFNANLQALATSKGWAWVDPYKQFRDASGNFIAADTVDGEHPSLTTSATVGTIIGASLKSEAAKR